MTDWRDEINAMLLDVIEKYELPEGSLYIQNNIDQKDGTNANNFSVCIWEPDYPPVKDEKPKQNKIISKIIPSTAKSRPDDLDLLIRETQAVDLQEFVPDDAKVLKQTKSDKATGTVKVRFNIASSTLLDFIRKNTEYCLNNYTSKATRFGCCSSFLKCSDAKKCVHDNKLYSKACIYRDSLDQGRIFYGKNRNID